ncbi:MAG: long-chain fatty acid--CoA ligase [Desulfatibacillum sp.]|nr:long-chain fatty acid--CoA ligase [Desulfatibacillum sp.]
MQKNSQDKWYITTQTFPELLHRNVTQFGERRAQWWKTNSGTHQTLNYKQLGHIVEEACCGLMDLGVKNGDRVALMAHTCPEWMQADYGILCAGAITVCVYPSLSTAELAFLIKDSGAKILFVQDGENLAKALEAWADMPHLEKVVVLQGETAGDDPRILDFGALRTMGANVRAKEPRAFEFRWKSVSLDDPMTIVYTSGTTGRPKGAVHTHASVNAACRRDMEPISPMKPDDVMLSFLPLSHTYERECGHGVAMHGAITLAYSSPKTMVEDLQVFKPTLFMSVPRIYERIFMALSAAASQSLVKKAIFNYALKVGKKVVETRADANGFVDMSEEADLFSGIGPLLRVQYRLVDKILFSKVRAKLGGRFRFAFSAAGALPADLCKVFMAMGIRIYEGYGATETCNTVNLNRPEKVLPGSVGCLCPGVEGRIAPDGEWLVKGPNNMLEYWNNPEATQEAFTEDGFYRTGDIVEELADGYLKIVDRKKGLMVLDTGKNVPSAKIESCFSLSRFVDTVVPVGDNRKYVAAIVIPDFDAFIEYFDANGIPYDKDALAFQDLGTAPVCVKVGEDFIQNPKLKEMVDEEIKLANFQLEEYETIKKYTISKRKLTELTGEVTPTLKIKRNVVMQNFAREIKDLYKKA